MKRISRRNDSDPGPTLARRNTWKVEVDADSISTASLTTALKRTQGKVKNKVEQDRPQSPSPHAPKKTAVSTFLSLLWRRPKPSFSLPNQNDLKVLLAESGLLLVAPVAVGGTRTNRPTKFSVVELCSSHEPRKGKSCVLSDLKLLTAS